MKKPPRNISRTNESVKLSHRLTRAQFLFPLLTLLFLFAFSSAFQPAVAQQRGRGSSNSNRARPTAKAQQAERARRAKALTLLVETADEARSLDDLFYRARLQALAADALYPFDQQRARNIFRRAWEAATIADKAEREAETVDAGTPLDEVGPFTEARDEVLAKTAARDTALADVFLRDLMKSENSENISEQDTSTTTARSSWWSGPSKTGERRLALGYQMLDKGETESAFRIVAPVVEEGASSSLMIFLLRLRERDAVAGEALYRAMLAHMVRAADADANTVLLLSTPIVSPELLVGIDESGTLQFIPVRTNATQGGPQPFSPATRSTFFNAAASILLRPPRPGVSETQDKTARYLAIGRLLPHFEREAPQHAAELQARAVALLSEFDESRRDSLSSQLNLRNLGAPSSTDPLRSHFEELARTPEQAERDRITTRIILIAARNRSWDRARRAAADLSEEGARRAANSFIALNQIADITNAYKDEKDDDYESIVTFLKSADVPPLASAWGYAQAASIAARTKEKQRVSELLTEAEHYAERADANTSQRVAAYGVIATAAARLEPQRAWELLTQLVKAANALDDFAGDEVSIEFRADENSAATSETPFTFTAEVFRLDIIFATMAHLDFERALASARALEGDVPRAFAQLAISRAVLEKK
ncbi:MAG TPA: hypothetical protein VF528_08095 [Pyrinomonadaceae bacterium]|jgi:hypothetical protein